MFERKLILVTALTWAMVVCLLEGCEPGADLPGQMVLSCKSDDGREMTLALNTITRKAMEPSATTMPTGELEISQKEYVLHFAKTDSTPETVISMNRYSGSTMEESGGPPFAAYNNDTFKNGSNNLYIYQCNKQNGRKF